MANFDPPFATDAEKRYPTGDERRDGFGCGPADQGLFNGLHFRVEAEVGEVIKFSGQTPSDDDMTQLRKAIQMIVAASIPDEDFDTSQFILLTQAQARLPIYPEVNTLDGRIPVAQVGTGNVQIPAGVSFLHRGIFPVTTVLTNFPTDASRIYHLRWNPTEGFRLLDLADRTFYNPAGLAEDARDFDTTYDNMLVARIITNSSNLATITNLANKNVLTGEYYKEYTFEPLNPLAVSDHILAPQMDINWGRTPQVMLGEAGANGFGANTCGTVDFGVTGSTAGIGKRSQTTRYGTRTALQALNPGQARSVITAQWQIVARA